MFLNSIWSMFFHVKHMIPWNSSLPFSCLLTEFPLRSVTCLCKPFTSYLAFLCLSFFTCEMGKTVHSTVLKIVGCLVYSAWKRVMLCKYHFPLFIEHLLCAKQIITGHRAERAINNHKYITSGVISAWGKIKQNKSVENDRGGIFI